MILLSILIPVYNQEELIKKAINSIPQRNDLEVIIVDDASTDKTVQSVESIKRNDLTLIKIDKRRSIGYCRNLCLEAAKGKFIFWLDSDDYVYTEKFQKFIDFLYKNQWCDLVHIDLIDNRGVHFNGMNSCGTPTKIERLETLNKFHLRFEDITVGEDLILWNALKKKRIIATHYKEIFYHYNYPRKGSTTWLAQKKIIKEDWKYIKK